MTKNNPRSGFVAGRFGAVWSQVRRAQAVAGTCWVALTAAGGLALLAALDWCLEMPWSARAVLLAGLFVIVAGAAVVALVLPLREANRPRTAADLENRFPQLGQRVRTAVQYVGRGDEAVCDEGVLPTLVAALDEETETAAEPLDLAIVVPRRKQTLAVVLAAIPLVLLLAALCVPEGRLAVGRALLGDAPYRRLAVQPGDCTADLHSDVAVSAAVEGRVPEDIALWVREADKPDAAWERQDMTADEQGDGAARFAAKLRGVEKPLQYQVVSERVESPVYGIAIRRPIEIAGFEADLTPPAYTGVAPSTTVDRDFEVIEGTQVRFRVQLNRPCSEASLVLAGRAADLEGTAQRSTQRLAMNLAGDRWTTQLPLLQQTYYRIVARGVDGTAAAEHCQRIRVRKDHPPRIAFLEPDEALEVHAVAEVLARVRVEDDFGLRRAGVVFRLNSGEERTLVFRDFTTAAKDGKIARATRETLEGTLQLEDFKLGETDGVTYYAFAEDNRPDKPNREESELRFIDIRPFRRLYKVGGT